jgi:hypothetical protein
LHFAGFGRSFEAHRCWRKPAARLESHRNCDDRRNGADQIGVRNLQEDAVRRGYEELKDTDQPKADVSVVILDGMQRVLAEPRAGHTG